MIELWNEGYQTPEGELVPVYVIQTGHGEWIHDPYTSTCGRFSCTPYDHGLTQAQAAELIDKNESAGYSWRCE